MRHVFLGSPPFAEPILAGLLKSPVPPVAVVTQPDRRRGRGRALEPSSIARMATDAGLPLLQPPSLKDASVLDWLAAFEADAFVVASYGELMGERFLALPRLCCLNVHPSLLPRHRGATPVQAALLAGDERTGVAIQRMVLALDAGDLVVVRETPIEPEETAGELSERLAQMSFPLVVEALEQLASGAAKFESQDEARVTRCRKLKKADGRIDWSQPADALVRLVRAMNPWPMAHTDLPSKNAVLSVLRSRVADAAPAGAPGTVLEASKQRFVIAAGEGTALELLEVQSPGKRPLSGPEFLNGARLAAGAQLGAPA